MPFVETAQHPDALREQTQVSGKGRIHYMCLQATREGQASHAHVHEIIRGLRRQGWDVTLFEPAYASEQRPVGTVRKLWEFVRIQLEAWSAPTRPDMMYMRDHAGLLPSFVWARCEGIPIITEVNGSFADYTVAYPGLRPLRHLIAWAGRTCYRFSNAVIAASPHLCTWVESEVGAKLTRFIPNGANTELFRPDAERPEGLPELYVSFVGAFAPWQGIATMLEAVNHPDWPSDVKLVIVGSGREQPSVENAAAQNPRICYLGRRPYREIPGIIAGGLAGISAQTNPGGRTNYGIYPLKVFETLACGVPAIVSDFPGQREIILDNECGFVIPQGDAVSLAQCVAYFRHNSVERARKGQRGREIVESKYSWQHSAELTETLIQQVLSR